jgi:hypothetical protein
MISQQFFSREKPACDIEIALDDLFRRFPQPVEAESDGAGKPEGQDNPQADHSQGNDEADQPLMVDLGVHVAS